MTRPLVSDDRWTCPKCGRTTVVSGSRPDTAVALAAVRDHHECGHAAAAGMALAVPRPRGPVGRRNLAGRVPRDTGRHA